MQHSAFSACVSVPSAAVAATDSWTVSVERPQRIGDSRHHRRLHVLGSDVCCCFVSGALRRQTCRVLGQFRAVSCGVLLFLPLVCGDRPSIVIGSIDRELGFGVGSRGPRRADAALLHLGHLVAGGTATRGNDVSFEAGVRVAAAVPSEKAGRQRQLYKRGSGEVNGGKGQTERNVSETATALIQELVRLRTRVIANTTDVQLSQSDLARAAPRHEAADAATSLLLLPQQNDNNDPVKRKLPPPPPPQQRQRRSFSAQVATPTGHGDRADAVARVGVGKRHQHMTAVSLVDCLPNKALAVVAEVFSLSALLFVAVACHWGCKFFGCFRPEETEEEEDEHDDRPRRVTGSIRRWTPRGLAAASAAAASGEVAEAEAALARGKVVKPRSLWLDHYRGMLVASMVVFHFAWDLRWLGLAATQPANAATIGSGELTTLAQAVGFAGVVVTCHLLVMALSHACPVASVVSFAVGCWLAVTRWPHLAGLFIMRGFCVCIGVSSALFYQRCCGCAISSDGSTITPATGFVPAPPWQEDKNHAPFRPREGLGDCSLGAPVFFRHMLRRLLRVSMGAAAVTAATFIVDHRHYCTFGALHAITVASVLHLPVLTFPSFAAPIASVLCVVDLFGLIPEAKLLPYQESSIGFQPVLPNLAFVLWGVAGHHHGLPMLHNPMTDLVERAPTYKQNGIFSELGRRALSIYLLHQAVLIPLALAVRAIFRIGGCDVTA
eukprot:TRINITY_DN4891_c0_g1_i1.p1 TRINITY_DN4891_c0_g1~~TRINITY_DN4891_c0_g1_i1.p1  ORF type:complete len:722 (-),score=108.66 TRINITY_DN4891_c0_g1_i1:56-2221(-)